MSDQNKAFFLRFLPFQIFLRSKGTITMTEQRALSQQSAHSLLKNTDANPLLYLSSADSGWEGLGAEAFRQPVQIEGLMMPERSDIVLMLLTGLPEFFRRQ